MACLPTDAIGSIATGNAVIKQAPTREAIRPKHRAVCLEMEGAGLINNFPCLVIRRISDYADSHKNDEWHTAAACNKELLEYVQPSTLASTRTERASMEKVADSISKIEANLVTDQTTRMLK
ncbi:hypothetical protein BDV12DRAFT_166529 [Aspergillus spectabilis]